VVEWLGEFAAIGIQIKPVNICMTLASIVVRFCLLATPFGLPASCLHCHDSTDRAEIWVRSLKSYAFERPEFMLISASSPGSKFAETSSPFESLGLA
jgi:hypothetical protein